MLHRSSLSTRAASSTLASTDSTSGVSEASSSLNIPAAAATVAGGSTPGTQPQQQQLPAPNPTLNTSAAEQTLPHQLGSDEPSSFSSFSMSHR